MSRRRRFEERCWAGPIAIVAAGLVLGASVQGQEPDSVTIDVSACVDLATPEERLACFEREVEAQRRPAAAAPAVAAPAAAAPIAAESRRIRLRRAEPIGQEIVAKVAELRETVPNAWTITLDNGQVWRQTPPQWYALRPGMEVRLYPTRWGNAYRLTAAEIRGFIQVERVR